MSELTWEKLSLLDIDKIGEAATYWATYIGQITEAAEVIEVDVPKTISEDNFGDQVGDDSRAQLQNISNELQDHIDEAAKKIKVILEDSHEDLKTCKDDMRDLIDEVLAAKLRIKEDGEVYISDARIEEIKTWAQQEAERRRTHAVGVAQEEVERVNSSECEPLTERVRSLVEQAKGHDEDYTAQLNALRDAWFEPPPPLGSDWHEDVAQYWADRAIDLLDGGADGEMSSEELDEFNELLEERGDNPVFATAFMETLGAEGLMTNMADIVFDVYDNDPGDNEFTAEQVNRMYEAIGGTLTTATDTSKEPHVDEEWVADLMNLGGSEVATSDGHWNATGYELLAPALPHGEYHEDFLVPVAEHIMALDATGNWNDGPPLSGINASLPDTDYGTNPMNYALEALDHNPRAALNLFSDYGTGLEDIDGVDLGDARPVDDPFEYLMDRADDYNGHRDKLNADLLGNALESATTGVSTDPDHAPASTPLHSNHMAGLTDRLIEYATDNPEKFTEGSLSPMVDNLGGITASYIDDFQRAMGDGGVEEWAIDQRGVDLALGSPGGDNAALAGEWMQIIGHDEAATAEVWGASEALMYSQMESAGENYGGEQSSLAYNDAFEMHGRLTGALTVGTLEGIADGVYEQAENKNAVWDAFSEGTKYGIGAGAGYLTANPWVAAGIGQGVGYAIDPIYDNFRMTEEEARAEIAAATGEQAQMNEDRMNTPATLENIETILNADPTLNETDRDSLIEDYYSRYFDGVRYVYDGYQD